MLIKICIQRTIFRSEAAFITMILQHKAQKMAGHVILKKRNLTEKKRVFAGNECEE